MTIINQITLSQEEEDCIFHLLTKARQSGYPSENEPFYHVIDSICQKYTIKKYQILQNSF